MSEPGAPRPADTFAPRRVSLPGRGHSLLVRLLRLTLPLAALVIIGVVIARLGGEPPQKISALPSAEQKTVPGQIELAGARYEGSDDQGRPYTITADKASRAVDAPDTLLFENPLADITLQDKTWVAVRAKNGAFERKSERLTLSGDVTVFHDSGHELHLQELQIDLKKKSAQSAQAVAGQGPLGTLAAQGLTVEDEGNLVIFGGPATLTLFLPAARGRG